MQEMYKKHKKDNAKYAIIGDIILSPVMLSKKCIGKVDGIYLYAK